MTEDYLIQEFHEAGIWLPEELRVLEARRKNEAAFAHEIQVLMNHPRLVVDCARFAQLEPPFIGQMIPMRQRGFLSSIIGGIFGSLPK